MKPLIIKVKAKIRITLNRASISFLRSVNATKSLNIGYSNGTGQVLAAGTPLYTAGTAGTVGYLSVSTTTTTTLQGTGTFNVSVVHYPSSTQPNQNISYNVDGSTGTIDITYNSAPVTEDIVVETENRTTYVFQATDFTDKITEPDGEAIADVSIHVDVTDIKFDGAPYVMGTWIALSDVAQGKLSYVPIDQDAAYQHNAQYKARDINGNESLE